MTLKKTIAYIFIVLLVAIIGVASVVFVKGDSWKEFALNSIGDKIQSEMVVGDVAISFFSTFPQVSVDIKDVRIAGAPSRTGAEADTLLNVSKLGIAFSLWEVLFGDPVIRSIYIEDGELLIEEFARGRWNYEISNGGSDRTNLQISSIHLSSIDFLYKEKGKEKSSCIINSASHSDGLISISFQDFKYDGVSDVFVPLFGELDANYSISKDGLYRATIKNGVLNNLSTTCDISWSPKNDIEAKGHFSNVTKDDLEAVFVEKEAFDGWSYSETTNLFFNSSREIGRVDFQLPEADFAVSPSLTGLALNNKGKISGKGWIDLNYKKDIVAFTLEDFSINSNGLEAVVSGYTKAWNKKPVEFVVDASLDLSSSYLSWIPNSTSQVQSYMPNEGNIKFSTQVSWMPSGEFKTSQIQIESSSIKGSLNSNPYTLSNVICSLSNGVFEISDLDYNWAGNIGEVSSRIVSFDDASKGGQIQGSVQVSAESIIVDPIFNWWENRTSDSSENGSLKLLPLGSALTYSVNADVLIWDGLECQNASSKGEITSKKLRISFAKADLLGGEATVQGQLKTTLNKISLGLTGAAEGFSYSELFRTYDNFGQTVLRAEHIQGRGEVAGSANMVWDKDGKWLSNSFDSELQASISNGRLKGLEVFDDVADYLKENRLIAPLVDPEDLRRRLADVEFDFVETPVSVSMSTVSIPYTNIQSSAMNVSLEGSQTFEGGIDYTLGFALRDLRDNKQGEFGDIKDDGLGNMFFLGMDGTLDEPVYSYDRKAHKAHRRRSISNEAQRIKDALSKDKTEEEEVEEKEQKPKPSWRQNTDKLDDPDDDDF